jgi:hypothetical protein
MLMPSHADSAKHYKQKEKGSARTSASEADQLGSPYPLDQGANSSNDASTDDWASLNGELRPLGGGVAYAYGSYSRAEAWRASSLQQHSRCFKHT